MMYYGMPCDTCLKLNGLAGAAIRAIITSGNHGVESDVGQAAWKGVKQEIKNLNPEQGAKYAENL